MIDADQLGRARNARPEVERALQLRGGLAGGVHALGCVRGAHRGGERPVLAAGRQVVVGDAGAQQGLVPAGSGLLLQRAGQCEVQLGMLAGKQVVVHDLAQQGVAEAVAPALVRRDDVRLRGLAQRRAQGGGVEAAGVCEDVVSDDPPCRQQAQHVLRGLAQALDAHHQRVAQRRGQCAAPVEAGRQQLLGEERVALAALEEPLGESRVRRGSEDVAELLGQLGAREALEADAARARIALELGEQRAQRVAAVQLVGAVGGDDEHPLCPEAAAEEDEERAGRAIRPVDVLQHERERGIAPEAVEQGQQRLEEARLGLRALVRAGALIA